MKNILSFLVILMVWFWFGGISLATNVTINFYAANDAETPCYTTTTIERNASNEPYFTLYDYNDTILENCTVPEWKTFIWYKIYWFSNLSTHRHVDESNNNVHYNTLPGWDSEAIYKPVKYVFYYETDRNIEVRAQWTDTLPWEWFEVVNDANLITRTDNNWNEFQYWTISYLNWHTGFTIMDRNLWATTNNVTNPWSYGYFYQWWNKYGFPYTANASDITSDTWLTWNDSYNNNGFYSDKFITYWDTYSFWNDNSAHDWIWWWADDNEDNWRWATANNSEQRQWPCPEWWHVPSAWERWLLIKYRWDSNWVSVDWDKWLYSLWGKYSDFIQSFKLPFAGSRDSAANLTDQLSLGHYWTSTRSSAPGYSSDHIFYHILYIANSNNANYSHVYNVDAFTPKEGNTVRCFKNTYERKYNVTFQNYDWSLLWSWVVEHWIVPEYEWVEPEKAWNIQYSYTFAWWEPELTWVLWHTKYTATFDEIINKYEIIFRNYDWSFLWSWEVEYGTTPVYGWEEPERAWDAQYSYTFAWWDKVLTWVTWEEIYTATFDMMLRKYDVIFSWADIEKQEIEYGKTATEPENPTKDWFTFDWWFKDEDYTNWFEFSTVITWNTVIFVKWNENLDIPLTWDDAPMLSGSNEDIWAIVIDENVPTWDGETNDGKDNEVDWSEVASGDSTATIEWWVEIYPVDTSWNQITGTTIIFSNPIAVKIHVPNGWNWPNWKDYMVKVRHSMDVRFWFEWLTLNSWAQCVNGLLAPEDQYKWEVIIPTLIWNQYYVIVYTCSASTFVAYQEVANTNTSTWWWSGWGWWGWGGWGWWGGWWSSSSGTAKTNTWTTVNTWTLVNTWETESNIEENNSNVNDKDTSWYQEWDQSEILSNWYSREFNNAYVFAYKNWITTMTDIKKADMNWPLTRIAMAKMLSNYAINILWKKPANIIVPKFPDVTEKLNEDYGWAVDLAYQLGIMWIWIDKFRPNDKVTRKEFGTALSRMLYWLADWTDVYYSTHLKKLKAEWIISNDNPNLKELRWYVMLMLMRSAIK